MNCDQVNPPEERDDERTLIYGRGNESLLSAEELRAALGVPSGERIEDYQGLSAIGIGGVGAVFSAHEPGLNREVALKILRPQFRDQADRIESFIREARATAQIDHPNIVPVHRLGVFDDVGVYFTMKRVEGETLREVRAQLSADDAGRVSPLTAARLGRDLFDLLTRIDDMGEGFVHRDISPSNVMVRTGRMTARDQVEEGSFDLCLVDFGSAASTQRAPEASFTARVGVARLATPGYAPPEMLSNDIPNLAARRSSPAVDVYAAASVLFELACGELTFNISGEKQDDSP